MAAPAETSDLPNDLAEYTELKGEYKAQKKKCKAVLKSTGVSDTEKEQLLSVKKMMRQIIKQCEKLHPDWKQEYKAKKKQQ